MTSLSPLVMTIRRTFPALCSLFAAFLKQLSTNSTPQEKPERSCLSGSSGLIVSRRSLHCSRRGQTRLVAFKSFAQSIRWWRWIVQRIKKGDMIRRRKDCRFTSTDDILLPCRAHSW